MGNAPVFILQVTTKKLLKRFIEFPYILYKKILKNKYWIAPLRISEKEIVDRKKYPFYQHAHMQEFLAVREKKVVGRIAAIIDTQYHKYREKDVAYFGFFECIQEQEIAFQLFDAALEYAKSKGMKKVIGPISPTTNHIIGTLLNDFEGCPMIQVPYNPEYYVDFYNAYGFKKEKDHYAFLAKEEELILSDKIKRVVALVKKSKRIEIRTGNMKDFDNELKIIREIYNAAWQDNSDFVPWTDAEFDFLANDLRLVIIPELTFLVFADGKPVGLSIPFNNFNEIFKNMNGRLFPTGIFKLLFGKKKISSLRLAIMGVIPEYRNRGIDALLVLETYERGTKMGYNKSEMSLVLEDNYNLVNMLENWGAKAYRTYRVYEKEL